MSRSSGDVLRAVVFAVALAVLGAVLGPVWAWWSPPGPAARALGHGLFIVDETEAFIASDGRYLVIAAVTGLAAGLTAWFDKAHRGPILLAGAMVGGVAGSLLMELVGHLTGGGSFTGTRYPGTDEFFVRHLPLSVHVGALLVVEPLATALLYGVLVAFAADDDLSRPDPVRDVLLTSNAGAARFDDPGRDGSVGAGHHPQDGWGYGDTARPLQQGDLPPQQPREPY